MAKKKVAYGGYTISFRGCTDTMESRTSRHRGKLFYRLLEQAVAVDPVPYAAMVKGVRGLRSRQYLAQRVLGRPARPVAKTAVIRRRHPNRS